MRVELFPAPPLLLPPPPPIPVSIAALMCISASDCQCVCVCVCVCVAHMQMRESVGAGKEEEGEGKGRGTGIGRGTGTGRGCGPLSLGPQTAAFVHPLRQRAGCLGRHDLGADEADEADEASLLLCQSGTSKCNTTHNTHTHTHTRAHTHASQVPSNVVSMCLFVNVLVKNTLAFDMSVAPGDSTRYHGLLLEHYTPASIFIQHPY